MEAYLKVMAERPKGYGDNDTADGSPFIGILALRVSRSAPVEDSVVSVGPEL